MRRIFVVIVWFAGLLAVVATSSSEEAPCEGDADEAACNDTCEAIVDGLHETLPAPAPTTGTCTTRNERVGCVCREVVEGEGEGEGESESVEFFIDDTICGAESRSGGCLVPPASFAGCDPADAASCADVCALLDRQRARDAAAVDDAVVASAGCHTICMCFVTANGRCLRFDEFSTRDAPTLSVTTSNVGSCEAQ